MSFFNTDRVLIWILILEEYVSYIEYIKVDKNIAADKLSILPLNDNQGTTHKYAYKKEFFSEINDTEELPEGIFPIKLKLIDEYQRKDPSLKAKYKEGTYKKNSFRGRSNIYLNRIMCEDNILFHPYSKSTHCIGTIRISFIQ